MPGGPSSRGESGRSCGSTTSQQARSWLRIASWPIQACSVASGLPRWRVTPPISAVRFGLGIASRSVHLEGRPSRRIAGEDNRLMMSSILSENLFRASTMRILLGFRPPSRSRLALRRQRWLVVDHLATKWSPGFSTAERPGFRDRVPMSMHPRQTPDPLL